MRLHRVLEDRAQQSGGQVLTLQYSDLVSSSTLKSIVDDVE